MDRRNRILVALAALILATALPSAGPPLAAASVGDVRTPESVCVWQTVRWRDLSDAERDLWAFLGWNAGNWSAASAEEYPSSEFQKWSELDEDQRQALVKLGYTSRTWNNIDEYCGDPG